jgi:hypothetical protein
VLVLLWTVSFAAAVDRHPNPAVFSHITNSLSQCIPSFFNQNQKDSAAISPTSFSTAFTKLAEYLGCQTTSIMTEKSLWNWKHWFTPTSSAATIDPPNAICKSLMWISEFIHPKVEAQKFGFWSTFGFGHSYKIANKTPFSISELTRRFVNLFRGNTASSCVWTQESYICSTVKFFRKMIGSKNSCEEMKTRETFFQMLYYRIVHLGRNSKDPVASVKSREPWFSKLDGECVCSCESVKVHPSDNLESQLSKIASLLHSKYLNLKELFMGMFVSFSSVPDFLVEALHHLDTVIKKADEMFCDHMYEGLAFAYEHWGTIAVAFLVVLFLLNQWAQMVFEYNRYQANEFRVKLQKDRHAQALEAFKTHMAERVIRRSGQEILEGLQRNEMACQCAICLEESSEVSVLLPCEHRFHEACVQQWAGISNSCPICRSRIFTKDQYSVQDYLHQLQELMREDPILEHDPQAMDRYYRAATQLAISIAVLVLMGIFCVGVQHGVF